MKIKGNKGGTRTCNDTDIGGIEMNYRKNGGGTRTSYTWVGV